MLRSLMLLPLVLLLGCGDEGSSSSGDPSRVTYASELNVDLAAMERRDSGLFVQDLVVGEGSEALANRPVTVHYTGWLPNGTRFDSSRTRNKPFQFTLGKGVVIQGWDEGVAGMRVGGQRKLVIPAALAYGNEPRGQIPANSVLVFDVELISVP
ncbi:FKBP-type peptidyl-prolyl cis-trans isomerase [Hyalangium rubrum]|uniref:Peptidyl-prolyl cis-trans isomerase n=1 Tax=Hyalangium rubrum TaxID=3103134 RepID=A0ABU5H9L9_9BACT|nr:FKBP-type peptidyl-prolyl cis-trans isomerase [Hyalangium sp. s54d21]MDY7230168.1 FKBP-type peptidyl-prolyl cis-trans isomerase [Hyalangium sp. s54d21]